ncbi:hypothetical protein [Arthrobacter bambusae]|uniref:hypothetical protein n=1 Tax=Arthrobacter bambusae TaxID=1338426 RepID=UPI0027810250|nr:hypothetical protein [Arthrobacter bambusae]MDQ0029046.1 hypothetical protein [Arthrobacter bambusae]MDQ0098552.1 hypothetical protein [Arthrobacter bambusae]
MGTTEDGTAADTVPDFSQAKYAPGAPNAGSSLHRWPGQLSVSGSWETRVKPRRAGGATRMQIGQARRIGACLGSMGSHGRQPGTLRRQLVVLRPQQDGVLPDEVLERRAGLALRLGGLNDPWLPARQGHPANAIVGHCGAFGQHPQQTFVRGQVNVRPRHRRSSAYTCRRPTPRAAAAASTAAWPTCSASASEPITSARRTASAHTDSDADTRPRSRTLPASTISSSIAP